MANSIQDVHAFCGGKREDFVWAESASKADVFRNLIGPIREGLDPAGDPKTTQLFAGLRSVEHGPVLYHWSTSLLTAAVQCGRTDIVKELLLCPYARSVICLQHTKALRDACAWGYFDLALYLLTLEEVQDSAGAQWNAALKSVAESKSSNPLRLQLLGALCRCPHTVFAPLELTRRSPPSPASLDAMLRVASGDVDELRGFGRPGASPLLDSAAGSPQDPGLIELSVNNSALYVFDWLAQQKDWPALAAIFRACPKLLCNLFGHRFRPPVNTKERGIAGLECCCCERGSSSFASPIAEKVRAWQATEKEKDERGVAGSLALGIPGTEGTWSPTLPQQSKKDSKSSVVLAPPSDGVYQSRYAHEAPHEHRTPFALTKLKERLAKNLHLIVACWMESAYERRKHLLFVHRDARKPLRANQWVKAGEGPEEGADEAEV
jgi:hypothetical protein